ncbi:MAG: hypothetical protein EA397_19385 [Deltaproteobacteria bacterium]|nr:MAG: hypothetical protein EA397_19385 [Deltaproteobacteria bacterium]
MLFHGQHYSEGILGFLVVHDLKRDTQHLCTVRVDAQAYAFRLDFTTLNANCAVQRSCTRVRGNFGELAKASWLEHFGKESVRAQLRVNGRPMDLTAHPCPVHPGNVLFHGSKDLRITAIRHDGNPWPVAAIVAVAVSVAIVAASVAIVAVVTTDKEVHIKASGAGLDISVDIGRDGQGGDSGNSDGGES